MMKKMKDEILSVHRQALKHENQKGKGNLM